MQEYLSIINFNQLIRHISGVLDAFVLCFNFLMQFIDRVQSYIQYTFERMPYSLVNRLMIYLIIVFILALLILLPLILFFKLYIAYKKKKTEYLFRKYSKIIVRFLMNDLPKKELAELKNNKSTFHRNVIINVLIAIDTAENKQLSGKLRRLYMEMKLDEDSRKKLKKRWHHKIRAIRELSHMRVKSENKMIIDFLQGSNEVLRIESQMGLIKLLPFVPFAFLDSQEKPFTVWEQINVFDLIRKKRIEIPEFHLWLDHWNDSVVMFCLDMIRVLKQKEAAPKVMELLYHDNELVKGKVIRTLVDLKNVEAVSKLKDMYFLEETSNKINIIRSIGKLRLASEIDFLLDKLNSEEFEIKMECCKSLVMIGEQGMAMLKSYSENCDEQMTKIINHVLDPRI
ncbi:HEAT repeat domain-containing protein [Labilibaculum sp.]|uniref:HEAT repeat domain-containing protein n=1 Tax=Labilibaculum sp. TaxID=2060723 RepID=UPI003564168D